MNKLTCRLGLLTVAIGLTLARPAASSAQNLYAASFSNSIVSYTPDGTATQFASLSNPFGLAYNAVPEPSTWAAVFSGAGLLGFVTLRQRRSAARA